MKNTGTVTANCPAERGEQWYFNNYTGGLIGMRSRKVPQPNPADPNSTVYGTGHFANVDPDANDLCIVPSLDRPFQGPSGTTYDVKNLAFLSTALYIGTQWKADITWTVGAEVCQFSAQAINPSVTCTSSSVCDPNAQPTPSGINNLYDQGCHIEKWSADITGDPAKGICFFNKDFPSTGGFQH
jgi:hypothetical protein